MIRISNHLLKANKIVNFFKITSLNFSELSNKAKKSFERKPEYVVWPNEKEVGDAFRNARVNLLLTKIQSKVTNNQLEVSNINYTGEYKIKESGDNISHEEFAKLLARQQDYFSSGIDLFVEDSAVIATPSFRTGVRVVTDNPVIALIARSLLIPVPPYDVIPIARLDGWKYDPRNIGLDYVEGGWNNDSKTYNFHHSPQTGGKGQRPVVVYYGGEGNEVAVQFIENSGKIAGADVILGSKAPISALIDTIGYASSVINNEKNDKSIALASTSLVKGSNTVLVIGADSKLIDLAISKNVLYGGNHNVISTDGISAFWNGVISPSSISGANDRGIPAVTSGGNKVLPIIPNNFAFLPKTVVFYSSGAAKSSITTEEGIKKIVQLTDEKNTDLIKSIFTDIKFLQEGNPSEILSLL